MRAAIIIAAKDIKERVRDRSAIILAIVVPLGLAFILNATLSGITDEAFETRIACPRRRRRSGGRGVLGRHELGEDRGFATVAKASTEGAARFLVDDDESAAASLIPSGFSAAVEANERQSSVVVTNPDDPIGADVAEAIVTGYAEEINAVRLSVATATRRRATSIPPMDELVAAAQGAGHPGRARRESRPRSPASTSPPSSPWGSRCSSSSSRCSSGS